MGEIMIPTFTVFTGPMFSSKSSRLLMELDRFKYQKRRYEVFKPGVDTRYSVDQVVTHSGYAIPAHVINNGKDLFGILQKIDEDVHVVAVDEAFMIPGIADALIWLYKNGIDIVVSSLDLSSTAKPFPEIERMMCWATRVKKCTAVCTICSRDAHYTYKKQVDDVDREIHVGGAELYEPRCARCHPNVMSPDAIVESVITAV